MKVIDDYMRDPNGKGKGMAKKKTIVFIAAITATLAISITAYGISKGIIELNC